MPTTDSREYEAMNQGMYGNIDIDGIPHPVEFVSSSSSSSRTLEVVKSTGKKIRDRTMPITPRQKRSRWVPGARYMPLLLLQWLWHPISVFLGRHRGAEKAHAHGHHQHDPRHFHHHKGHPSAETTAPIFTRTSGDLFMEWWWHRIMLGFGTKVWDGTFLLRLQKDQSARTSNIPMCCFVWRKILYWMNFNCDIFLNVTMWCI